MKDLVNQTYGGKLRVRVNGILINKNNVLLIQHLGVGSEGSLWIPPGGGMEFGSNAEENLIREFKEESGLSVAVRRFMFVNEYCRPPLHTIELFYEVEMTGGKLNLGRDPEFPKEQQIMKEIRYFSFDELNKMDRKLLHNLFRHCSSIQALLKMNGYFNY